MLAAALGQGWVAADHEPFLRKVGMRELDETAGVVGVDEAVALQPANGGALECGDPMEVGMLPQRLEMRVDDHPAIANQDHLRQRELLLQTRHFRDQRGRVGDVARMHREGHGTAPAIAQQPEIQLQFAALAITAIAKLGQLASGTFKVGRGHVIQHRIAVGQQPLRQFALNAALTLQQPIHGVVQLVHFNPDNIIVRRQRCTRPPTRGRQFGTRTHDACRNHRTHQIACAAGGGTDQVGQLQMFKGLQDREHRSVDAALQDAEGPRRGHQGVAGQVAFEQFDGLIVKPVEVG